MPNQHPEPEFTWEDIHSESRMVFASLDEMRSFLAWKSGRLEEQLEALRWAASEYLRDTDLLNGSPDPHARQRLISAVTSNPATSAVPVTPEARAGSTEPGLLETAEGRAISERADALNAEGEAYQEELQRLWDADRAAWLTGC